MPTHKTNPRPVSLVAYAHLVYLGSLPALATFGLLYEYGHPAPLLLFLGGTAAVGVYLAVTFSYTPPPRSLAGGLLVLLDGPAWALLSMLSKGVFPLGFVVETFIVDGTAVWLSILVLSFGSPLPTRGQRVASVAFMLVALAATASLVWPYFRDSLWGSWASLCLLAVGTAQASAVRFRQLRRDHTVQDVDASPMYIVALIAAWVCSMIAGNVLHEINRKAAPRASAAAVLRRE